MAASKDLTIEEKLKALYELQKIDSKIDDIKVLRGELPMEVSDLEDEIIGLNSRLEKLTKELEDLKNKNSKSEQAIIDSQELIKKYEEQSKNVRNNREFEAVNKEIELQDLEIQLSKKKIRDSQSKLDSVSEYLKESELAYETRKKDLEIKKEELLKISAETDAQEEKLRKKAKSQAKKIEERFLTAYTKIKHSYKNGLAVVTIDRDSCGGCFAKIPPQRQLEIHQRKRILPCEHCGRILVDEDI